MIGASFTPNVMLTNEETSLCTESLGLNQSPEEVKKLQQQKMHEITINSPRFRPRMLDMFDEVTALGVIPK